MSLIQRTEIRPLRSTPQIGLRDILVAALTWPAIVMRRRRGRRELARLDDHLLRDIGLTRYDIGSAPRKPYFEQR